MPIPDREMPETLDLIAKLVANVSTRLDKQGEALADLAKAQGQAQARTQADPELVARVTAQAVREVVLPDMRKLVDVMDDLTGRKEVLQERIRAIRRHDKAKREEARGGRRLARPLAAALVAGIPLLLVTVLALAVPRAAAHASLTCRVTGGTWSPATERFLSGCTYSADTRATAGSS